MANESMASAYINNRQKMLKDYLTTREMHNRGQKMLLDLFQQQNAIEDPDLFLRTGVSISFLIGWPRDNCPVIKPTMELMAALAATEKDPEPVYEMPFNCFLIDCRDIGLGTAAIIKVLHKPIEAPENAVPGIYMEHFCPKLPEGGSWVGALDNDNKPCNDSTALLKNFLNYLSSVHNELSPRRPLSKGQKKKGKRQPYKPETLFSIGGTVDVNPSIVRYAERNGVLSVPGCKHIRRGHWLRQVCGKGRKDRKLQWRKPTWVNKMSEGPVVIPESYTVR